MRSFWIWIFTYRQIKQIIFKAFIFEASTRWKKKSSFFTTKKLLTNFDQLEIKQIFLAVSKLLPSIYLFFKSKQWKRQSNLLNFSKVTIKTLDDVINAVLVFLLLTFNPFVPNALFLYSLTTENLTVFWCF